MRAVCRSGRVLPPTRLCLLALLAIGMIGGCASRATTDPMPTSAPPTPSELPATLSPQPSPTTEVQPTVITLRLWLPPQLNPYDRAQTRGHLLRQLAAFARAYPELAVDVVVKTVHGRGGMLDFLRTAPAVAPSVMPDLMIIDASDLETAVSAGLIQPLDDVLPPSVANDRYEFATQIGQVGDQTMGFVMGVTAHHQAYRTDVFEAPPLDWMDVVSATAPFVFPAGGREGLVNDATLIQYLAAGGGTSDANGNPHLDRGPLLQVFSFYSRCIAAGVISPTAVLSLSDDGEAWDYFRSSQAGVVVVEAGAYRRNADETTAPAPAPTRYGEPFSIARGWVITMVAQDPARQSLARLLLDWLIASEQNAAWARTEGYLPGTRSAVMFWEAPEGERVMLSQLLEATRPAPPAEVMALVGTGIQRGLEAVLSGQAPPDRAAAIAIDYVNR